MKRRKKTSKFVYANKNIPYDPLVKKDDVGIIGSNLENSADIFFIRIGKKINLKKSDFETFDVKQTGDAYSKKICNVCHKLLDTNEFAKNQNGKNNRSVRRPSCGKCREQLEGVDVPPKIKKEWSKKKPQDVPFQCPICAKRTIAGVTSKIVLDHNHRNGKVRGWVCDSCNTGIGRFKDDVGLIKRAIKFLK